jgi:tripartite-type tricarboxylate transporter receptor subunit TctC
MVAPPGTPSAIAEQINRAVNDVLAMPEIQAQFETLGVQPHIVAPPELAAFIAIEATRWADVARDAKIEKE